jgi:putative flavoprotein involved in K+ transport
VLVSDTQSAAEGTFDVVIIGAGHAGLATSYCLSQLEIDHVVLERGEVANSWRKERWDSLTLLTQNWQSRVPGFKYSGDNPDGFMSMPEVVEFISNYAEFARAPVRTHTTVTAVRAENGAYVIETSNGTIHCRSVVVASGACNVPVTPRVAQDVPDDIRMITPHQYRDPSDLDEGGVLVVGASATGLQLADEIHQSGRPVTIAVGEHVRMPRTYRGRDIQKWLADAGILDESYEIVDDIRRARSLPSPQLIGCSKRKALDLNSMTDMGISLVGRLMGMREGAAQFSGSLLNVCALADLKLGRMLDSIDEWAESSPEAASFPPPERLDATRVEDSPPLTLNLREKNIRTIVWATGFRPDYSWLDMPVFDHKGAIKHDGGVMEAAGLYVIGLPVLRTRKSSFIHGTGDDARFITQHLARYLARPGTENFEPDLAASL